MEKENKICSFYYGEKTVEKSTFATWMGVVFNKIIFEPVLSNLDLV